MFGTLRLYDYVTPKFSLKNGQNRDIIIQGAQEGHLMEFNALYVESYYTGRILNLGFLNEHIELYKS